MIEAIARAPEAAHDQMVENFANTILIGVRERVRRGVAHMSIVGGTAC
jgi:hypothetical protein